MNARRCSAETTAGKPCRAFVPVESGVCRLHDPARAAEVRAARSRGAAKANKLRAIRGKRLRLDRAGQLARFLSDLVQTTLEGRTPPDVARACFYGCAVLRQTVETAEIERRLAVLEQHVARQPRKGASRWA